MAHSTRWPCRARSAGGSKSAKRGANPRAKREATVARPTNQGETNANAVRAAGTACTYSNRSERVARRRRGRPLSKRNHTNPQNPTNHERSKLSSRQHSRPKPTKQKRNTKPHALRREHVPLLYIQIAGSTSRGRRLPLSKTRNHTEIPGPHQLQPRGNDIVHRGIT